MASSHKSTLKIVSYTHPKLKVWACAVNNNFIKREHHMAE